jgi:hypothetical protein
MANILLKDSGQAAELVFEIVANRTIENANTRRAQAENEGTIT